MFTGIVEEMGTVLASETVENLTLWDGSKSKGVVVKIACSVVNTDADCYIGASISVNGVCLTVIEYVSGEWASFGVAPETLRLTNLATVRKGDKVNLERASLANARNSGHYVQGHVDATAEILEKKFEGDSLWVTLSLADRPDVLDCVVKKGFVAVDGTSLTVCNVDRTKKTFNFMLVQHTQSAIVVPHKPLGARCNIEVDVVAKYATSAVEALKEEIAELKRRVAELEGDKKRARKK